MSKSGKPQVKPLNAYKELSERQRRLVNKLITSLRDDTIPDESHNFYALKRIINRARRPVDTTIGGKPNNGYLEFYREQLPGFRENNKEMKITEVASEMGKKWRALASKEQDKYKDLAREKKNS